MRKNKLVILIFNLFIIINSHSQCAMCKASLETNLQSEEAKGAGINEGILYLMSMPYIALLLFTIFWYLQNRRKVQDN